MKKINCNVDTCSHNNLGICYANRVNIGNTGAKTKSDTCCGSFLSENIYGTLTNNTNDSDSCSCLICKATTCKNNNNNLCELPSINILGNSPITYIETYCSSFCSKHE